MIHETFQERDANTLPFMQAVLTKFTQLQVGVRQTDIRLFLCRFRKRHNIFVMLFHSVYK